MEILENLMKIGFDVKIEIRGDGNVYYGKATVEVSGKGETYSKSFGKSDANPDFDVIETWLKRIGEGHGIYL